MIDDKLIQGVLDEELYMFSSFYPAPIDTFIREEMVHLGIEVTEENVRRVIKKDNGYYIDDKPLVIVNSHKLDIDGWVGSQFVKGRDV
jgi:hypothetical protein